MLTILHQLLIESCLRNQFIMSSTLNDSSLIHHNDFITITNGTQSVSNNNLCSPTLSNMVHDIFFFYCIESAGYFIQNQDNRCTCKCSGDFHTLTLTSTKILPRL